MAKPTGPQQHIFLIYALVVLYALCYQLQSPLEPFLVERFIGKDKAEVATSYGRLQSFFNVVQAIGSLTFGYILDRFGVRVGLIVNFSACALTYYILSTCDSLSMLFLSKVPGVGMAGFLCAQTAVSQLTPAGPERIAALGRLTTAYTIGGVIGPYCGGLLGAKVDYFIGAKCAMVGSLVAVGLCFLLPSSLGRSVDRSEKSVGDADKCQEPLLSWIQRIKTVFAIAGFLTMVKLVSSTANSMASSSQSLILKNQLGFTEENMGMFMSAQFAFGGIANGFLLGPLTSLLGGQARTVVGKCLGSLGLGYILLAALNSDIIALLGPSERLHVFIGMKLFLSVFQYSLSTSITAESTQLVPESMKGTLIGMEHCIFSAARILTPAIGVSILTLGGASALYASCATIFVLVFVLWTSLSSKLLPTMNSDRKNA